jgi:uncharacterized protein
MLFCKAPIAGQVKTRLSSALTPKQCVDVHIELSNRTLSLATQNNLCHVQLWCSPSIDDPFFSATAATYKLPLRQQQGANLGERMHHAFCSALQTYRQALIIGCDCPSLTELDLKAALSVLVQNKDIVLAPAEDGGYVLIGVNQPRPELFHDMPWGQPNLLTQTRALILQHNFKHGEIKQQWDVDTPADLLRYYEHTSLS